jgi:hypothetical protein
MFKLFIGKILSESPFGSEDNEDISVRVVLQQEIFLG